MYTQARIEKTNTRNTHALTHTITCMGASFAHCTANEHSAPECLALQLFHKGQRVEEALDLLLHQVKHRQQPQVLQLAQLLGDLRSPSCMHPGGHAQRSLSSTVVISKHSGHFQAQPSLRSTEALPCNTAPRTDPAAFQSAHLVTGLVAEPAPSLSTGRRPYPLPFHAFCTSCMLSIWLLACTQANGAQSMKGMRCSMRTRTCTHAHTPAVMPAAAQHHMRTKPAQAQHLVRCRARSGPMEVPATYDSARTCPPRPCQPSC